MSCVASSTQLGQLLFGLLHTAQQSFGVPTFVTNRTEEVKQSRGTRDLFS